MGQDVVSINPKRLTVLFGELAGMSYQTNATRIMD